MQRYYTIPLLTIPLYYLYQNIDKKTLFRYFARLPYISDKISLKIDKEITKFRKGLINDRFKHIVSVPQTTLSFKPLSYEDIRDRIDLVSKSDNNKISGAIYVNEEYWCDIVGKIYGQTAWLNPTHNSVWPELIQMEAELYRMCSELYNLSESNGILTSGGTMSNIEAVYTYRNKYEIDKRIINPNIVASSTAHSSFRKACQILKVEYRVCKIIDNSGKIDVKHMRSLIDSNTILLITSAPSFPYGIIDPIKIVSEMALEYGIGCHIDACLGGFQVPFANDLSEKCDFSNAGVTSISADLHKFGKTPKGISILMFRSYEIKKYLTYVDLNWSGGLYVMPDFPGSRPGAMIVISWSMMNMIGQEGYIDTTNKLIKMREDITLQIEENFVGQLYVYGEPELSVFGLRSDLYNIHYVNKKMTEYGWEFNELPDGMHFCLTEKHFEEEDFVNIMIEDLRKALEYIEEHLNEDPGETAKIYCSTQEVPQYAEDILDEIGRTYVDVQTMVEKTE